jgi:hypothetical protein
MRTELNISIPEPCHENWDKMSPNQKGRHCQVCEKTVVDFTSKTDETIVKYFLEHNNICGRFKNQQLNRPVVLTRKSKNNYWSFLASGLFGFLSLVPQDSKAQTPTKTVQTDTILNHSIKGKIAHSIINIKTIFGTILDENGLPLPTATVLVKGTQNGTSTDFDGNYTLKVKKRDTLIISYVGYLDQEIQIETSTIYNTKLEIDPDIYQSSIIAGYVSSDYKSTFERKLRRKQRRMERKKTRQQKRLEKNRK